MNYVQHIAEPIEQNVVIVNKCTDDFNTAINTKANNLDWGIKESTVGCRICLWEFESVSELRIHYYLEHMNINR